MLFVSVCVKRPCSIRDNGSYMMNVTIFRWVYSWCCICNKHAYWAAEYAFKWIVRNWVTVVQQVDDLNMNIISSFCFRFFTRACILHTFQLILWQAAICICMWLCMQIVLRWLNVRQINNNNNHRKNDMHFNPNHDQRKQRPKTDDKINYQNTIIIIINLFLPCNFNN